VVNIYHVRRAIENINFKSDVGNVRLLSHASRVENFVGILSRLVAVVAAAAAIVVVVVVVVVVVLVVVVVVTYHYSCSIQPAKYQICCHFLPVCSSSISSCCGCCCHCSLGKQSMTSHTIY